MARGFVERWPASAVSSVPQRPPDKLSNYTPRQGGVQGDGGRETRPAHGGPSSGGRQHRDSLHRTGECRSNRGLLVEPKRPGSLAPGPAVGEALPDGVRYVDFGTPAGILATDFVPAEWFMQAVSTAVNCDCRKCYGQSSHPAVRSYGLLK